MTVLRYVERNPVRANLVRKADAWFWSSARLWSPDATRPTWLSSGPVPRPEPWLDWVNAAVTPAELEALRRSVARGRPFGDEAWSTATAAAHGLQSTLRPRGRPRLEKKNGEPEK